LPPLILGAVRRCDPARAAFARRASKAAGGD
jgi:hypothetical protein